MRKGCGVKRSRFMSLAEAFANVAVGYGIAVVTQILVFPLFGLAASLTENMAIGAIFTAVSIVRSYTLRRMFEAMRARHTTTNAAGWWPGGVSRGLIQSRAPPRWP